MGLDDSKDDHDSAFRDYNPRIDEQIIQDSMANVMDMMTAGGHFREKPGDVEVQLDLDKLKPYSYTPLPTSTSVRLLEFSNRNIEFVDFATT